MKRSDGDHTFAYKSKLRLVLLVSGVALTVFFLFVQSIVFYDSSSGFIQKRLDERDQKSMIQLSNRLTLAFEEMEMFTANLANHHRLRQLLQNYREADGVIHRRQQQEEILSFLNTSITFYSYITGIEITGREYTISNVPYTYLSANSILSRPAYEEMLREGKVIWLVDQPSPDSESCCRDVSVLFAAFVNDDQLKQQVLITVRMDHEWFGQLLNSERDLAVYNAEKLLIWSNFIRRMPAENEADGMLPVDRREVRMKIAADSEQTFSVQHQVLGRTGWHFAVYNDLSQAYQGLNELRRFMLIAMALSVFGALILSARISRKVTLPVHKLLMRTRTRFHPHEEKTEGATGYSHLIMRMKSFREVLIVYYVLVVCLPLLLHGIVYFVIASRLLIPVSENAYHVNVQQTAENIDHFLETTQRIGLNVASYPLVQRWLKEGHVHDEAMEIEVQRLLDTSANYLRLPVEITIYDVNGDRVVSNANYDRVLSSGQLASMIDNRVQKRFWVGSSMTRHNRYAVEYYNKILDLGSLQTIGFVGFSYLEQSIQTLYKDIVTTDSLVELVQAGDEVFSGNRESGIGSVSQSTSSRLQWADYMLALFDGKEKYVGLEYALAETNWRLRAAYPVSHTVSEIVMVLGLNVMLFFLFMLMIVWLSYWISSRVSRALVRLEVFALNWHNGGMGRDPRHVSRIFEVEQLSRSFDQMAIQIEELTRTMYESKWKQAEALKENKELELQVLQSQINPHFLYNALEAIKWMIMDDEKNEAAEAIENLGQLFRHASDRSMELVDMQEEIAYTKLYVSIQKIRFGDQLRVDWQINPNVRSCRTIKMMLQPIVENAIHHGMENRRTSLQIRIKLYEQQDRIHIEIRDNGRGMTESQLAVARQGLEGPLAAAHIGLRNVRRRGQLKFGDQFDLKIDSRSQQGTTVVLSLPKWMDLKKNNHFFG